MTLIIVISNYIMRIDKAQSTGRKSRGLWHFCICMGHGLSYGVLGLTELCGKGGLF